MIQSQQMAKKGCIIGGKVFAKGDINAKTIGSELGVSTRFTLGGEVSSLFESIKEAESSLDELKGGAYTKTEQCLAILEQKMRVQPNNPKYRELKLQYTKNKFMTQHELNKKEEELQKLNNKFSESGMVTLHSDTIFPGTHIRLGHDLVDIEETKKECTVRSIRGEVNVDAR